MTPPTHSLKGWTVIPELFVIRVDLQASMGQQRGLYAADAVPADGWRVVFDMRYDGGPDEVVCERDNPDGSVSSAVFEWRQVRSVYPPRSAS